MSAIDITRRPRGSGPPADHGTGGAVGLSQPLPLGAGVRVRVDPGALQVWLDLPVVREEPGTRGLLTHLLGAGPARRVLGGSGASMAPVAVPGPRAWLRVAALDAVDRWLHLPVEGALVDAERAVARAEAARLLPHGPAREAVLHEALGLARGACYGLEDYFQQLSGPLPEVLSSSLRRLVAGYQALADITCDAEDLRSIALLGRRTVNAVAAGRRRRRTPEPKPLLGSDPAASRGRRFRAGWTSAIDPRQVPARVVELSEDPAVGEVFSRTAVVNGVPVLDVEAPAFAGVHDPAEIGERLIARLVDRLTGQVHARQVLTMEPRATASGKRYVFRTRFPLEGLTPARVRVDIVDAEIHLEPLRDSDPELSAARRAVLRLRAARAAVASRALDPRPPATLTTGRGRPLVAELALAHELARVPTA